MKPKALLTTIPSDAHNWNLIYIQLLMEENGAEVINLGACTAYEEIESACLQVLPDFIVVSTVNGHGFIEGRELIMRIREIPQMKNIPVYLGGKLSTDQAESDKYALELEAAGYTRVYCENKDEKAFVAELRKFAGKGKESFKPGIL
ncbi:MAG: cobalamin B12-binding domain-containing protein [Lewinellaceae bacterium]|nr:cobalamin-dependent protein [Lewinella sp.]MCB9278622.1 cobalamin B12-binding domain-containing protein [Lewinellaceae bacterium]